MPTPPAVNLGTVITNPRARQIIYAVFVVLQIVVFLLDLGFDNNPGWLNVVGRVLDGALPFVLLLAAVNAPTGVYVDGENATLVGTSQAEREAARNGGGVI